MATQNVRHRSFNGCWTCRLRRKRCDERHPACETCTALLITCHYNQDKPDWMDGGERQRAMVEQVKNEIKEKAATHGRRGERERATLSGSAPAGPTPPRTPTADQVSIRQTSSGPTPSYPESRNSSRVSDRAKACKGESNVCYPTETVLISFYLDHVVPFVFPFYRPSPLEGGYSWILEFLLNSPVKRKATLSQAAYFFALANDQVPTQSCIGGNDFPVLREALDVIVGEGVEKHLHGSVRILTGILQIMHYELWRGRFSNWGAHLNAALALLTEILGTQSSEFCSGFGPVLSLLGPEIQRSGMMVPGAEQAAFKFSTAGLVFADIIASTARRDEPQLYKLNESFLSGETAPVKLQNVMGIQNWVLMAIAQTASLNAWKYQRRASGDLDMMELVHRAAGIKDGISYWLTNFATTEASDDNQIFAMFEKRNRTEDRSVITSIWGQASLLYLSIVVNGWQPANFEVRHHVRQIIELMSHRLSSPLLLRTLAWPLCVAGCLAEPQQEILFCSLVRTLPTADIFGTIHKAHDIMANVWRNRDTIDSTNWDLASSCTIDGEMALLI